MPTSTSIHSLPFTVISSELMVQVMGVWLLGVNLGADPNINPHSPSHITHLKPSHDGPALCLRFHSFGPILHCLVFPLSLHCLYTCGRSCGDSLSHTALAGKYLFPQASIVSHCACSTCSLLTSLESRFAFEIPSHHPYFIPLHST